ncbi:hypothetical protein ACH5RR_015958 [Cinchona calisaya]|uniref:RNase H type-1 domain-containing protein n=1 Tax=Cinchona calisaya TaxID=153742 RepID=A0ABD2ZUN4_9GENT
MVEDSHNEDKMRWKFSSLGKFTVKSTYYSLMNNEDIVNEASKLKNIWKGRGPNRANHLVWLARHGRLMTSNLKMKMTLKQCDVCLICQLASETTIHAIRDCLWIEKQVLEILDAITGTSTKQKQEGLVGQEFSRQGWVKLNVDNSARSCPCLAGGGGLFRNDHGHWLFGFTVNISEATSLVAELWAILKGLEITLHLGFKHLEIESDSLIGVQVIKEATEDHQHYNFIDCIRKVLSRD